MSLLRQPWGGLYCDALCAGDAVAKVFAQSFCSCCSLVSCASFVLHLPVSGGDNHAFVTSLTRLEKNVKMLQF